MSALELVDVSKRYGEVTAVDHVSLRIEAGEMLVLLGGSGSGKTTTLKMMNRLIEPTSGKVILGGEDVTSIEPHVLRRRIGYVFQRLGLFPHMTVAGNVGVTPSLLGWSAPSIRARVDALLELVELDPALVRDRRPSELSGGQAQRVAVARALAAEPKVLLFDEPFGALDPITRERIQTAFSRIHRDLGITVVFVTHDMAEALLLGDRIGVMRDGRLLQVGSGKALLDTPSDPYVSELVRAPLRQATAIQRSLE